jgi:phage repressor protein C with HTH and peptisase S24 domain
VAIQRVGTVEQAAAATGLAYSTLQKYLQGDSEPPVSALAAIAKYTQGSITYYVLGEDVQLAGMVEVANKANEKFKEIPRYDVFASAGDGRIGISEKVAKVDPPVEFHRDWLRLRASSAGNCRLVSVVGDSMEPLLKSGDVVLIDHGQQSIRNGEIYLLRIGDDLLIKRLATQGEMLSIISANEATHPRYEVAFDEAVEIYGRLIWSSRDW